MAMKRPRTKFQKENVLFYGKRNMAPAALQHHGFSLALELYAFNTTSSNKAVKAVSYQGKHV